MVGVVMEGGMGADMVACACDRERRKSSEGSEGCGSDRGRWKMRFFRSLFVIKEQLHHKPLPLGHDVRERWVLTDRLSF